MRYSLIVVILASVLIGCTEAELTEEQLKSAVAIERADECHLCGMIINNFDGPKGQLFQKGEANPVKFCSNRDLFSYLLQPENVHRASQVFVHDMAKSPWESPDDDHFIDAKSAYYVVGSSRTAAMGMTLASFSEMASANQFKLSYGGEIVKFDAITMDLLMSSHTFGGQSESDSSSNHHNGMTHEEMDHESMAMNQDDSACDQVDHGKEHTVGMNHDTSLCKDENHNAHHSDIMEHDVSHSEMMSHDDSNQ